MILVHIADIQNHPLLLVGMVCLLVLLIGVGFLAKREKEDE